MKTRREGRTVERMLSRRCYRSRYLLACEPSARSRLMARSVMNVVAARGHGNHGSFLVPQIPTSSCPAAMRRALSHAHARRPRANVRALLSMRPRDAGFARKTSQGVATREDYWFTGNKSAEILHRDFVKLDSGVWANFSTFTNCLQTYIVVT